MLGKVLSILPHLLGAAKFFAAFFFGRSKEKNKNLEKENAALRNEIERLNSAPVTDDDVDRMLADWEAHIRDQ